MLSHKVFISSSKRVKLSQIAFSLSNETHFTSDLACHCFASFKFGSEKVLSTWKRANRWKKRLRLDCREVCNQEMISFLRLTWLKNKQRKRHSRVFMSKTDLQCYASKERILNLFFVRREINYQKLLTRKFARFEKLSEWSQMLCQIVRCVSAIFQMLISEFKENLPFCEFESVGKLDPLVQKFSPKGLTTQLEWSETESI